MACITNVHWRGIKVAGFSLPDEGRDSEVRRQVAVYSKAWKVVKPSVKAKARTSPRFLLDNHVK